jgi:myo-inositol-1(or 4)-monophosphatase
MSAALQERFDAACDLARGAGQLALGLQSSPGRPVGTLKGAQDWLTEADGAVEQYLAENLRSRFPDDGFIGEEKGERHAIGRSGLRWIVDPIDGTSNFARGRQRWCVSIGLYEGDRPMLGVLDSPALGDHFRALVGREVTLNGSPIGHSGCDDLSSAMVEFGWSPRSDRSLFKRMSDTLLDAGAMPRAGGSGALGLADVACGRVDAFIELNIQLWDVAGAMALLTETGCRVDHSGLPGPIVASSPSLDLARLLVLRDRPDGVS